MSVSLGSSQWSLPPVATKLPGRCWVKAETQRPCLTVAERRALHLALTHNLPHSWKIR